MDDATDHPTHADSSGIGSVLITKDIFEVQDSPSVQKYGAPIQLRWTLCVSDSGPLHIFEVAVSKFCIIRLD